jgi:hypothetical protein
MVEVSALEAGASSEASLGFENKTEDLLSSLSLPFSDMAGESKDGD